MSASTSPKPDDHLPTTGNPTVLMAAVGAGLLLAGGSALYLARRRRLRLMS